MFGIIFYQITIIFHVFLFAILDYTHIPMLFEGLGSGCNPRKGSSRWRWRGPPRRTHILVKYTAKGGRSLVDSSNAFLTCFLSKCVMVILI